MRKLPVLLLEVLCCAGCRYAPPNSNCEWPADLAKHGSLAAEAEFAEDLAIRHADAGRSQWNVQWRQCIEKLFPIVAARHGVTTYQVGESLAGGRPMVAVAEGLLFAPIYLLVAYFIARRVSRRYPGQEDLWDWGFMSAYVSLAVGAVGVLAGETWSQTMESLRLGTGHLSYRMMRIAWSHHRPEIFAVGVVLFWLVAAAQRWKKSARVLAGVEIPFRLP
jgi:hypothetical protein